MSGLCGLPKITAPMVVFGVLLGAICPALPLKIAGAVVLCLVLLLDFWFLYMMATERIGNFKRSKEEKAYLLFRILVDFSTFVAIIAVGVFGWIATPSSAFQLCATGLLTCLFVLLTLSTIFRAGWEDA